MSDNLMMFLMGCLLVWAIVRIAIARFQTRSVQQQVIETKVAYIPESLLYLAGAVPGPDGGWMLCLQGVQLVYIGEDWKYLQSNPMMRGYGKWMKVNQNRVLALMEASANERWNQQQQVSIQSVQQPVLAQPATVQMQWPIQKDANGKRIPNVTAHQAEQWYADNDFGWSYDPNGAGLWMPEPYMIRKDKQTNSPTFGKWIVDKRKQP